MFHRKVKLYNIKRDVVKKPKKINMILRFSFRCRCFSFNVAELEPMPLGTRQRGAKIITRHNIFQWHPVGRPAVFLF